VICPPAGLFRLLDHRDADAVVDAPARIDRFRLDQISSRHVYGELVEQNQGKYP